MIIAMDRGVIESISKQRGRIMERYEGVGFGGARVVKKLVESVLIKELMRCGSP